MAFAISARNLPAVSSYTQACILWEARRGLRHLASSQGYRERYGDAPLADHRRDYMGVSMEADGDVVFRYHDTNVVTWHADGRCTLDLSYASVSTQTFAHELGPSDIRISLDTKYVVGGQAVIGVHTGHTTMHGYLVPTYTCYRVDDVVTLHVGGERTVVDVDDTQPFIRRAVNRQRAKEARSETRYDDFAAWLRDDFSPWVMAKEALGQSLKTLRTAHPNCAERLRMLEREDDWPILARGCGLVARPWYDVNWRPARVMADLREAIYHHHGDVWDDVEVPCAVSMTHARQMLRSEYS